MSEQEIEKEIDETEDKAKAIGKEIGVEDDTPDYDIQEEDDDNKEDEKIAKEREPSRGKERKVLTNKEKRDLRKKRINEKFTEKDSVIAAQQEEIDRLKARQDEIDGRLMGINKAEVDKALNATIAAFNQAEKDHADAFAEGDGAKATKAMRVMYDAQRQLEQLQAMKEQVDKRPEVHEKQPRVDSRVADKAKAWAKKNDWYDPSGKDVDSEIAKAISGVLAAEGYDPTSDDFWDELDDRIADRIPEKVSRADDEEEEEEAPKPRKRTAPPVNGNGRRSDLKGKKTITLPTSYINMLKANGIWDDVPRRNKIIADRERILKDAQ